MQQDNVLISLILISHTKQTLLNQKNAIIPQQTQKAKQC